MNKFWDKVRDCKHENTYDCYHDSVYCSTPYCSASEYHCKDCGVFITECGCGSSSGMSGWSSRRVDNYWKRKLK